MIRTFPVANDIGDQAVRCFVPMDGDGIVICREKIYATSFHMISDAVCHDHCIMDAVLEKRTI